MNKQKGIASLAVMVVMLVMAVALPITTKLVQQTQENRSKAADPIYYSFLCLNERNLYGCLSPDGCKSSVGTETVNDWKPIKDCGKSSCHNGKCDVEIPKVPSCSIDHGGTCKLSKECAASVAEVIPGTDCAGTANLVCCKPISTPIAGACSNPLVKDGCSKGSIYADVVDTDTKYKWQCSGTNGSAACSIDKPVTPTCSGTCMDNQSCITSGRTAVKNSEGTCTTDPLKPVCCDTSVATRYKIFNNSCNTSTGEWTCSSDADRSYPFATLLECKDSPGCDKVIPPVCTSGEWYCSSNGNGLNNKTKCGTNGSLDGSTVTSCPSCAKVGTVVTCNTAPPVCTGTYHCVYSGVNNCKGYCIDACGKTDPSSVFDKCTSTVTKTCAELGGVCRGSSSCTLAETKIEGATPCSSGVCCKPLTCGNVNGQIPGSGDGGTACYGLTSGVTSCEGLSSADKYYDYKSALGTCNTTGAKCCTISKKTVVNPPVITVCSLTETQCTSDGKNVETCNSTRTGFITTKGCGNLGCNKDTKDCNTAPPASTCLTACPNGRSTKEYCIGIRTEPVDGLDVNADKTGCTPLNCYHCDLSKCEKDATRCVNSVLQSCTKQVGEYWLWNDVSDCGLNNCITTNGVSSCKVTIDPPTDTLYCDNTIPYGCKEGTGRKAVNTRESDTMFEWDCFDNTRGISVPCSMKKCTLGDTRCDSDYIMQTCISGGIWGNKVPCTGDAKCTTYSANRGVCGVDNRPACEIRETKCVNGKLATCNSSRTGWNPGVVCPDASQECLDGYKVCTTKTGTNPTPINPPPTTCSRCSGSLAARGDATCDGVINELDFSAWLSEYQKGTKSKADFNCSGSVGIEDFSIWNTNFRP